MSGSIDLFRVHEQARLQESRRAKPILQAALARVRKRETGTPRCEETEAAFPLLEDAGLGVLLPEGKDGHLHLEEAAVPH